MLFKLVVRFLEFINVLFKVLKWTSYFIHDLKSVLLEFTTITISPCWENNETKAKVIFDVSKVKKIEYVSFA